MTRHVVMFSSGAGSWAAARRVADEHGTEDLFLLFADVRGASADPHIGEDDDNYRFLKESAVDVGGELVIVADGRTIWDVFRDKRFLGNTRLASCSAELKQAPARKWLAEHCDPTDTVVFVGIDWSELHRLAGVRRGYAHPVGVPCEGYCRSLWDRAGRRLEGPGCRHLLPHDQQWHVEAPLTLPPYRTRDRILGDLRRRGIEPPRLYDLGFQHANCGGGCVKAGAGQFVHLLRTMPERFAVWEREEESMREFLGKDVSILRDRTDGDLRPLTLSDLREREATRPEQLDLFDLGGCGCFVDEEPVDA